MTTQTTTLTDFLLARLAEDEATARDEAEQYRQVGLPAPDPQDVDSSLLWVGVGYMGDPGLSIDPARVLAEVEAKRRIVALHSEGPVGSCETCSGEYLPCSTLRALALPYADHREFDESWRP